MKNPLEDLTVPELLQHYFRVESELRRLGIIRTNNLTGDYAAWLVARCLNLELRGNSNMGFDAVDESGSRYQIKSRRIENTSTPITGVQFGFISDLEKRNFDYLIGVVFAGDFTVRYAVKIPHAVIGDYARFREKSNGHRLVLRGPLLADQRVENITGLIHYMFAAF